MGKEVKETNKTMYELNESINKKKKRKRNIKDPNRNSGAEK